MSWVGVLLALICLPTAFAHEGLIARKALASARTGPDGVHLDVMAWMRIRGDRVKRLTAQFDFDRNGILTGPESRAVARLLAPQAVGGFTVTLKGLPVRPMRAEYRAVLKGNLTMEIAILMTYALGRREIFDVTLSADLAKEPPRALPLLTEFSALPPLHIMRSEPPAHNAVIGPVKLVAMGAAIEVVFSEQRQAKSSSEIR